MSLRMKLVLGSGLAILSAVCLPAYAADEGWTALFDASRTAWATESITWSSATSPGIRIAAVVVETVMTRSSRLSAIGYGA